MQDRRLAVGRWAQVAGAYLHPPRPIVMALYACGFVCSPLPAPPGPTPATMPLLPFLLLQITGQKLGIKGVYGKPNPEAYELVEQALLEQAARIGLELPEAQDAQLGKRQLPRFSAIYGIGDNPEADIRGANGAGGSFRGFYW